MGTIYILWLRQLKRYVRSKARMIGSLGQPILFLFALGFGLGPIYAKAGGGDYIQFLAPGVIAMAIIFTAMFGGIEIIWDKQFGFLKETLVAPVSRFQIMLGRTLGGATVAMIQGIVVFLIALLAGFHPVNWALLPAGIGFMFLIALFFTALGTAIASKLPDMQAFPLIMNFLMMPLFFLSGALFPLAGLTGVLLWITRFNPLSYGVDGVRGAFTGLAHFGLGLDFLILGGITLLALWFGSWLFSRIEA
jgi:ABC-2 type transport system permease protein